MATNNPDAKLFDPTAGNGRNYEMTAPTRDEVLAMAEQAGFGYVVRAQIVPHFECNGRNGR